MQRAFKASAATNRTVFEEIVAGRKFGRRLSLVSKKHHAKQLRTRVTVHLPSALTVPGEPEFSM